MNTLSHLALIIFYFLKFYLFYLSVTSHSDMAVILDIWPYIYHFLFHIHDLVLLCILICLSFSAYVLCCVPLSNVFITLFWDQC